MRKNDLIEKLKSIDGNQIVFLDDPKLGIIDFVRVKQFKIHEGKYFPGDYVKDKDYKEKIAIGDTYYKDNYRSETEDAILLF